MKCLCEGQLRPRLWLPYTAAARCIAGAAKGGAQRGGAEHQQSGDGQLAAVLLGGSTEKKQGFTVKAYEQMYSKSNSLTFIGYKIQSNSTGYKCQLIAKSNSRSADASSFSREILPEVTVSIHFRGLGSLGSKESIFNLNH